MREYPVMIYLDHAATSPMRPGVWEAMEPFAVDNFGNSSGLHGVSRAAKNVLEEAREQLAALIGAAPMEIVFTAGGTESDNLAVKGAVLSGTARGALVTSAIEHDAVLESAEFLRRGGTRVRLVGVDSEGRADPEAVARAVDGDTTLVSIMLINNETGAIQDLAAISAAVKRSNPDTLVHTDAVQAFASEPIDVGQLGVDLLTVSAHKFGGPKGSGFLYVREGTALEPVIHGGGQELGRRSGTHDVAAAVGLATAAALAFEDRSRFRADVASIRDRMEERLETALPGLVVNTPKKGRSSHHL
ncbi:MAG: cysteine desulfurase family protein, partial [Acidimicrobiia bacterium]